jgi:hypothetical protein
MATVDIRGMPVENPRFPMGKNIWSALVSPSEGELVTILGGICPARM